MIYNYFNFFFPKNIDSIKFEQMTTPELERLKQVEIDDFTLKYDDIERMTVPELTKKIKVRKKKLLFFKLINYYLGKSSIRFKVRN